MDTVGYAEVTPQYGCIKRKNHMGFPCGPGVKNSPCNAGDASSIPGPGTGIPRAAEKLGPRAPQLLSPWAAEPRAPEPTRHN